MSNKRMRLYDIYNNVADLKAKIGKNYDERPTARLGYVAEEVGEFAREVNCLVAARSSGRTVELRSWEAEEKERLRRLAEEGFDLIWNVCATLASAGVDIDQLEQEAWAKMRKNDKRDFPTHGRPLKEETP